MLCRRSTFNFHETQARVHFLHLVVTCKEYVGTKAVNLNSMQSVLMSMCIVSVVLIAFTFRSSIVRSGSVKRVRVRISACCGGQ